MRSVRWLASYPKSGNTWVRALLTNYLSATDVPADINALVGGYNAAARDIFDNLAAVEASEFTLQEIDRYRPQVYRALARTSDVMFIKVHDAYSWNDRGEPLFPDDVTFGVLYLVRNPLDVAVSFSHHRGASIASTVRGMCRDDWWFDGATDRHEYGLRCNLRSWSDNVCSWIDRSNLPVTVVRYEDLAADPVQAFGRLLEGAGIRSDRQRIEKAAAFSRFEELRKQELASGFHERSAFASSFFRQGRVGGWRDHLTPAQVDQLVSAHSTTMARFGYLPLV